MNIDWSKAPEDATHAGATTGLKIPVFYKDIREDKYSYWHDVGDGWREDVTGNPSCTPLIERPKKQYAWDGGGDDLPPIGAVCEHAAADNKLDSEEGQWFKVEIIAHHKFNNDEYKCAVWVSGSEISYSSSGSHFRPIKTAEQLAEEERNAAIQDIRDIANRALDRGITGAEAIYLAGYRKQ